METEEIPLKKIIMSSDAFPPELHS